MAKLSNKQLLKRYREVFLEYKTENNFGNFCARTLTILLYLEKELSERGYKIASLSKENIYFVK
ncbi:MAG: hypothetical protein V1655_01205 [bacterium]